MDQNIVEAEIEQSFGRTVFNHKIHEKQAEIYQTRATICEMITIVLSALTSSRLIAILFANDFKLKIASAIVSLISTGFNLYSQKFNYRALQKENKICAHKWLSLRQDYTLLITDIRAEVLSEDQIIARRNELNTKYQETAAISPQTTDSAYKKAGKSLKINQDNYISLDTINSYLPLEIRRNNNNDNS